METLISDLKKVMNKGLNSYPFAVQIIALPISWIVAILKVLIAIPVWITAKCNSLMESIE